MTMDPQSPALKSWLIRTLEPICEADPEVLAKYIQALISNPKINRQDAISQLEDFLRDETSGFVNRLFTYMEGAERRNSAAQRRSVDDHEDNEEEGDRDTHYRRRDRSGSDDEGRHFKRRRSTDEDLQRGGPGPNKRQQREGDAGEDRRRGREMRPLSTQRRGYNDGKRDDMPQGRGGRGTRGPMQANGDRRGSRGGGGPPGGDRSSMLPYMRGPGGAYDVEEYNPDNPGGLPPKSMGGHHMRPIGPPGAVPGGRAGPMPGGPGGLLRSPVPPGLAGGAGWMSPGARAAMGAGGPMGMGYLGAPLAGPGGMGGPPPGMGQRGPHMFDWRENGRGGRGRGGPDEMGGRGRSGRGSRGGSGPGGRFGARDGGARRRSDPSGAQGALQENTADSCTLRVTNVDSKFINMPTLSAHFAKFGNVVNVQMRPEFRLAYVQFSTQEEAKKAYHSPIPVCNNRFIEVKWAKHNPNGPAGAPSFEDEKPSAAAGTPRAGLSGETGAEQAARAAAEASKVIEQKKQLLEKQRELQRQKEDLLKKQLEQARALLEKMNAMPNASESDKAVLIAKVASLSEMLSKEQASAPSLPSPSASRSSFSAAATNGAAASSTTPQGAGDKAERLASLEEELKQLESEASTLGIGAPGGAGTPSRGGRFGGRFSRGAGRFSSVRGGRNAWGGRQPYGGRGRGSSSLDLRTTYLRVASPPEELRNEASLQQHFGAYGTVESVTLEGVDAIVKFKERYAAEKALQFGKTLGSHALDLAWHDVRATATTPTAAAKEVTEDATADPDEDLRPPEDDDLHPAVSGDKQPQEGHELQEFGIETSHPALESDEDEGREQSWKH